MGLLVLLSVWAPMASMVIMSATCTRPHARLYHSDTRSLRSREERPYPKKVMMRLYDEMLCVGRGAAGAGAGGGGGGGVGNATSGTSGGAKIARSMTRPALLGARGIVGGAVAVAAGPDASWIGRLGST
jgi:hypothetical protein